MLLAADLADMLGARGRLAPGATLTRWGWLPACLVAAALSYGAVMGGYSLRPLQMLYSALKVPLLVAVSSLICLPNFFVLNTILGLRDDLPAVMRGALLAQGTVAVSLAALAPVTAVAYLSLDSYADAVAFNGVVFLAAALAGQVTMSRHYQPLIAANPRHRIARDGWLALYVFVTIQMGWVLRPFVGDPDQPTRFFRAGAWSNAYVEVATLVWRTLSR
jgi:hypothetical protein